MKKEVQKPKKVTIDDLAVMVAKGFNEVGREIGEVKDRLGAVENRLGAVENRLGAVENRLGAVENRLDTVEENIIATRRDLLTMGDRFVLKYEMYDLSTRVGVLEQKAKSKK